MLKEPEGRDFLPNRHVAQMCYSMIHEDILTNASALLTTVTKKQLGPMHTVHSHALALQKLR